MNMKKEEEILEAYKKLKFCLLITSINDRRVFMSIWGQCAPAPAEKEFFEAGIIILELHDPKNEETILIKLKEPGTKVLWRILKRPMQFIKKSLDPENIVSYKQIGRAHV